MQYSTIKLFIIILTAIQLSACASMFNGNEQQVSIKTHSDAEIYIDDRFAGNGYTQKKLARDEAHVIRVSKGECEQTYTTQAKFNKTSLLGLFIDVGLISIPVDFMTGAAWDIYPDRFIMQPQCMNDAAASHSQP
ncbi:hypothetical protein ACU6U9_20090 [Pseudomonas sp. HK3]